MKISSQHTATLLASIICLQGLYLAYRGDWSGVFVALMALVLSYVPFVLLREYGLAISWRSQVGIVLFVLGTLILGEIHRFYTEFPWWDLMIHFAAGLGLAILGYRTLFKLVHEGLISATPVLHSLGTAAASLAILTIWEVYEFVIDELNWSENQMQVSNFDTMTDLVAGLIGIVIVCIPGYVILRRQPTQPERDQV